MVEQGGRGDRSEGRWKEGERYEIKGEEMDFQTFLFVFCSCSCFWEGREGQNRAGRPRLLFLFFFIDLLFLFHSFISRPPKGLMMMMIY